ncbi:hypothetical protein ACFWXZ_14390 [[Kitasatospora] papulosa]|uniref:hypothetical protein n=1 Tax=[Kitasatospora] papulosa TaxID=1464011 RepID=UPI0036AE73C0
MPRNIGADRNGDVYRAVIVITEDDGTTWTKHEGPYDKPSTARARVTFWTRYHAERDPDTFEPTGRSRATGHIEQATTTWERV